MAVVEVDGAHDFWDRAPRLLQEIDAIGAALVSSRSTDVVRRELNSFAAAIPQTPEPLGEMDPYLRDALLTGVIHALRSQSDDDRREMRIAVERVRQALRDALDERPVWQGGSKAAALWLKEHALRAQDVAELTGASPTKVRRWFNQDDATSPSGAPAGQGRRPGEDRQPSAPCHDRSWRRAVVGTTKPCPGRPDPGRGVEGPGVLPPAHPSRSRDAILRRYVTVVGYRLANWDTPLWASPNRRPSRCGVPGQIVQCSRGTTTGLEVSFDPPTDALVDLPCDPIADLSRVVADLCQHVRWRGDPHVGYEAWVRGEPTPPPLVDLDLLV